ncbi:MAG: BamA/TamA family outer membrane protein [Prevotella sp.]|nr:BamA/TamA family outer membrane protein [Prevotella sp.]
MPGLKSLNTQYITLICVALLFASCSTTKHIPEGDQLFVGLTKIAYEGNDKSDHFTDTQVEVEAALATAPNGALFGSSYYRTPFPYALWIWNWANPTDGDVGKVRQWFGKTFGKPPVLMSQVNPSLRASVAQSVLRKNGYLHGRVTYEEVPQKNPKKMKIGYTVKMDTLFTVDTMSYERFPKKMRLLIDSTSAEARIKAGEPFAVAGLDGERTRLSQLFRNSGYYYYQSGYASYLADTFDVRNRARLRLQLADSLPKEALRPWYIGKVTMQLRRSFREQMTDSVGRRFLKILYNGKHSPMRPGVILRNMKLRPRQLFSQDDYQESMQKINATGVFSSVDFRFTPRDNDTLDLTLNCTFDKPYDFYVETNFISRTIGRMGPEVKVGLTRRNAFRGGEKLDVNLHGAYEWQTSGQTSGMNSYQYGIDASVEFPRIILPWRLVEKPRRRRPGQAPRRFYATPWTIAKVSSDVVQRPSYYKMHIVTGEWLYRWQPSPSSRHELSPLTVKYQFMNSHTDLLDSLIWRTPYLMTTMSDYFVPKMRYTYTYASPTNLRNPIRWETTVSESGNAVALYDVLIQGRKWNEEGKTLFKNPYSQFVGLETDLTKTWTLDQQSQLVGHVNAGIIYTYGNSSSLPFSETFYVGGANSIRAFAVRSIGPGSFNPTSLDKHFAYMTQNGNAKLVLNLEYRRQLFGSLYGAIFLDAGNVWNSDDWIDDPDNDGTRRFRLHKIFSEMATGTGLGLRYDLDFLVLRIDWGFGFHLPYDTGKGGYFNIPRFKDMHALHLAIGYPF